MYCKLYLVIKLCFLLHLGSVSSQFPYPRHPTKATPYPPAPLHYVNIGHKLDGDYKFGYDTGKGPLGQSFREEVRLADGTIQGTYGLVDEQGHKRVVHYTAGKSGFIAQEDSDSESIENPILSTSPPQPRFVDHPNSNYNPRHVTSPVSPSKLSNYQQTKTKTPLYKKPYYSKRIPQVRTPEPDGLISPSTTQSNNEREMFLEGYNTMKNTRNSNNHDYNLRQVSEPMLKDANFPNFPGHSSTKKATAANSYSYRPNQVSEPILPRKDTNIHNAPEQTSVKQVIPAISQNYRPVQVSESRLPHTIGSKNIHNSPSNKQTVSASGYNYRPGQVSEQMSSYKVAEFQEVNENKLPTEEMSNYNYHQVSEPMRSFKPSSYQNVNTPAEERRSNNYNYNQRKVSEPMSPFRASDFQEVPENKLESMRQLSLEVYEVKTPEQLEYADPSSVQKVGEGEVVVKSYKAPKRGRQDRPEVSVTPFSLTEFHQTTRTPYHLEHMKQQDSVEIYRVQNTGGEEYKNSARVEDRQTIIESYKPSKDLRRVAKQDNDLLQRSSLSPYKQNKSYRREKTVPAVKKPEERQEQRSLMEMYQAPVQTEYESPESIEYPKEKKTLLKSYRSRKEPKKSKTGRLLQSNKNTQKKEMMGKTRAYDPKVEDEYYDTEPAFIDIERLSYNIGTNKNRGRSVY